MKVKERIEIVDRKLAYYVDEMRGLRDGSWYSVFFGLLIVLLLPLFLFELVILIVVGRDLGIFQSNEPNVQSIIDVGEVPS